MAVLKAGSAPLVDLEALLMPSYVGRPRFSTPSHLPP